MMSHTQKEIKGFWLHTYIFESCRLANQGDHIRIFYLPPFGSSDVDWCDTTGHIEFKITELGGCFVVKSLESIYHFSKNFGNSW